jgi:hypothetical protein
LADTCSRSSAALLSFFDGKPLVQHDHSRHQAAKQMLGKFVISGGTFSDLVHRCLKIVLR